MGNRQWCYNAGYHNGLDISRHYLSSLCLDRDHDDREEVLIIIELKPHEMPIILPLAKKMLDDIGHMGGLDEQHFLSGISAPHSHVYVEMDDGVPIGIIQCFIIPDGFSKELMAYTWFSYHVSINLLVYFNEETSKKNVKSIFVAHIEGLNDVEHSCLKDINYRPVRAFTLWSKRLTDG